MGARQIIFDVIANDRASSTFDKIGDAAGRSETKLSKTSKVIGAGLAGAAVAAAAWGKESVSAYAESQDSANRLEQALAKFPKTADTNVTKLGELNSALSQKTKFDDDATASGQAILAQFGLTGKQLEAITPLMQDYAAKTGKDLPTAAQDLGKAMLGQGKALKAVGLNFEDAGSASANYEQLMSGLRSQVGGFAASEGKTAAGQAAILSNQFGELQETTGAALMPTLQRLAGVLLTVVGFVQDHTRAVGIGIGVVAALAAAIVAVNAVMTVAAAVQNGYTIATKLHEVWGKRATAMTKAQAAAQAVLNAVMAANPLALVIIAVVALVAAVVLAYQKSETFRAIVDAAFRAVGTAAKWLWDTAKAAFSGLVGAFENVRSKVNAVLKEGFRLAILGILTYLGWIINGAAKAFGWIPGIGGKLKDAAAKFNDFRNDVNNALSGIQRDVAVQVRANLTVRYSGSTVTTTTKLPGGEVRSVRMQATGGPLHRGMVLVGERGPELLDIRGGTSGQVIAAQQTRELFRGAGAGGAPVVVQVTVQGSVIRERDLARSIRQQIADLMAKNGGDPAVLGLGAM